FHRLSDYNNGYCFFNLKVRCARNHTTYDNENLILNVSDTKSFRIATCSPQPYSHFLLSFEELRGAFCEMSSLPDAYTPKNYDNFYKFSKKTSAMPNVNLLQSLK